MKKLLTLSLLLIGATTINAQSLNVSSNPYVKETKTNASKFKAHVRHMLELQQGQPKLKTTALKERVIGESSYELYSGPVPNIYDTTQHKYSGTNGSRFNFNIMEFISYYDFDLSSYAYPYDWSVLPVMADTTRYWSKDSATGPLVLNELTTATFNANKNITSFGDYYYYLGAPDGTDIYLHSYNAQGKISEMLGLSDYGSGLDTTAKFKFFYNAQGRLDRDTIYEYTNGQWVPSAVVNYTYDGAGNITEISVSSPVSSVWVMILQYVNTFYSDNKLKTSTAYEMGNATVQPTIKDSLGYDNNSAFPTFQNEYYWNNNVWEPGYQATKHLNAQGLPDTVYQAMYDNMTSSWMVVNKNHYTYTSYGNPQRADMYSFNGTTWDLVGNQYFYYEIYNDATAVKDVSAQEQMTVYPNPATNELNISWKQQQGNRATIELINGAGQKAYAASVSRDKDKATISIQSLAPGMYWLLVRNEAGAVIFRQGVLKQ